MFDEEDSLVDTTPMADFDPANMLNVESKEKDPDWDWLCGCLLNKPMEVVKATWNATTKYAVNYSTAYPMKRHFKSRFSALNVCRLKELKCQGHWGSYVCAGLCWREVGLYMSVWYD